MVQEGRRAPTFAMPVGGGGKVALKDLKGKKVVLFFYPRDDTPGCTAEAKDFTGLKRKFSANRITVIGVSKDTAAKHEIFFDKHNLRIPLTSDESGAICEKLGARAEKKIYDRKFMGIERSTFLIDEKGIVAKIWRKVNVKGHAEGLLAAAKEI